MTHLWNPGIAIDVGTDERAQPCQFRWQGQVHPIRGVAQHWRIDVEWWRREIGRDYFKVYTTTGLLVVIYRDLPSDSWYLQRLYD